MMRITDTVKHLIIINVIFYAFSQFVPASYELLALHYPANKDFGIWQLFSYMFMHAPLQSSTGISHILFNMLGLWMFGSPLEQALGTNKFLFFYFSCGVGAGLFSLGIDYFTIGQSVQALVDSGLPKDEIMSVLRKGQYDNDWANVLGEDGLKGMLSTFHGTSIGASGALYGVMVAFAFMFPNAELMMIFLPIPIKAKFFIPGLLLFDLVMGIRGQAVIGQGDGIAHFAHVGGALIGFIMMMYWKNKRFNHNRWN